MQNTHSNTAPSVIATVRKGKLIKDTILIELSRRYFQQEWSFDSQEKNKGEKNEREF